MTEINPLLKPSPIAFGLPDFKAIKTEHYLPALDVAMQQHIANMDAIANNPAPATFANTIIPLELAPLPIYRISGPFDLIANTCAITDEVRATEQEFNKRTSGHYTVQAQRPDIFARVTTVYNNRATLTPVEARLVEEYHMDAVRAGALLPPEQQAEFVGIEERLSVLSTKFRTNVAKQTEQAMIVDDVADLTGLPADAIGAAAEAAEKMNQPGKYAFPVERSVFEKFMSFSDRRDLREKFFGLFVSRGDRGDEYDNNAIIPESIELKQRQAALLGYPTYGHFVTERNMARTPEAAFELMQFMYSHGVKKFESNKAELQALAAAEGFNEPLKAWDIAYYTNKYKQQKFGLDESEVSQYLQLENVTAAVFDVAQRLYGITMTPQPDLPLHHPDARAWEMKGADGKHIALFILDPFARKGKRPGAWMDSIRGSHGLEGGQTPIVLNVCNFTKPDTGKPALISLSDVTTLFHEFGHGLHGMLTTVPYPSMSGTIVRRDFVELPSQFMEHFMLADEVVFRHYRHAVTGASMPADMLSRIKASDNFNEGRDNVRYAGSALMDLALHQHAGGAALNVPAFEAATLKRIGMPEAGDLMHRPAHHMHSISGYPSQYYVYGWARMHDCAAIERFTASGDLFHQPTAQSFRENILATGNSRPPEENWTGFYGGPLNRDSFLRVKGFMPA